jgi:hypothetical protein
MARVICLIAWALVSACRSLSFGPADMNAVIGDDFSKRLVWPDSSILQYELAELTGWVIYEPKVLPAGTQGSQELDNDALPQRVRQILKPGTKLSVRPIMDGRVYESKIDSRAAAQGSYLAFASKLDSDKKAHVTIDDAAICLVSAADIPWDELTALAQQPDPEKRRYWVQGTLLTLTGVRMFHKLSGSTEIGVADAFGGANGEVYVSNDQFKKSPMISMLTIDLDELLTAMERVQGPGSGAIGEPLTPRQMEEVLKAVRVAGIRETSLVAPHDN